jgi:hypothetical protein
LTVHIIRSPPGAPVIGVLTSRRTITANISQLINSIAAQFGTKIVWADRQWSFTHRIDTPEYPIWFKEHGNKFAGYVEFTCTDVELLARIAKAFPEDFPKGGRVRNEWSGETIKVFP